MHDDSVFHEWRAADREAHAQELLTTKAALRALEGKGEIPSEKDCEKARTLRESADALFRLAMHEFRSKVALIKGS